MTPIESQTAALAADHPGTAAQPLSSGAHLITVPGYRMPEGWNLTVATILFLAPPGFPAAQPDCFWVEATGSGTPVRLANGATPQASNDANPIPDVGQRGTWFSWHLATWNPNKDSLTTYLNVIRQRLKPAR